MANWQCHNQIVPPWHPQVQLHCTKQLCREMLKSHVAWQPWHEFDDLPIKHLWFPEQTVSLPDGKQKFNGPVGFKGYLIWFLIQDSMKVSQPHER